MSIRHCHPLRYIGQFRAVSGARDRWTSRERRKKLDGFHTQSTIPAEFTAWQPKFASRIHAGALYDCNRNQAQANFLGTWTPQDCKCSISNIYMTCVYKASP